MRRSSTCRATRSRPRREALADARRALRRRGRPLERHSSLRRTTPLRRKTALARKSWAAASAPQRVKVGGRRCLACNRATRIDPAHVVARSLGGCDDALCVVALCRDCHRRYDRGELDLVPHLEPDLRAEAAHAVEHLGLAGALRRLSGTRA